MLRRYNSKNLDTIVLKNRRTTIGSKSDCDVVVKGSDVTPVHASIQSTSSGFFLRDHSLTGNTKVNEKRVVGQQEIHAGDMIQVGSSNPPFVFDSEWMFGTRPNSAKLPTTSTAAVRTRTPTPVATNQTILPAIEKKVIHNQSSNSKREFGSPTRKRRSAEQSLRSSASSTESNRGYYGNGRSVGNNLLQRVVQLQAEVINRDEKIRQLTSYHSVPLPTHLYYPPSLPPPPPSQHSLPIVSRSHLSHSSKSNSEQKAFELFAYRAFISAITSQLRQFNDRVLRTPQRDSAELFTAMCRAVDIPLSHRIIDIEKHCEAVLIDNDFEDGDELISKLDNFLRESRREKILELTNELEVIMPLIRDAASNARENIKVCNVFTQWSRQFGDLLRKSSFSATTLFQAIDDLKAQFSEAHMSRHWLPPSITPILRLAALELEKRDGEVTPSASPRPQMERKKSIDMTLDTCISQVEAIVHEMDYHVVRLYKKAKDYNAFQALDLDSVLRISKVIEAMRSSIEVLSEHSFKEEVRPNSVLFFEITNEDITNRKKSDSDGSQSSLGSLKRVSAAPKIPDPLSENDEIVEERREVEEKMMEVVRGIEGILETGEENPMRNEGMISVDASVLKMLIQESHKLLSSYHSNQRDEEVRRKRSIPPMITVQDEDPRSPEVAEEPIETAPDALEESEPPNSPEDITEAPSSPVSSEVPKSPESPEAVIMEVQPVAAEPVADPSPVSSPEPQTVETPVPISDSPDESSRLPMATVPEEEDSEVPLRPKRSVDHQILRKSHSLDAGVTRNGDDEKEDSEKSEEPTGAEPPEEEHPESPSFVRDSMTPEELPAGPPPAYSDVGNVSESESLIDDESDAESDVESEEENTVSEERNPFTDDDKSTVRYIPKTESQATSDLTPLESLQMSQEEDVPPKIPNGEIRRQSNQERMSSHLRSHINTANGKPHITYQYPIKYYSPPMKRRSKSMDQKIKDTLSNRPPFVLY